MQSTTTISKIAERPLVAGEPSVRSPRRVVALGGGTGLPAVLRGLKQIRLGQEADSLTAVVTVSDDVGSSGRLRRTMGLPPPGDIRNCLVALAEEEDLLSSLFQHRYRSSGELTGHSVGNLILAALAEKTGTFLKAIEASSHVLRTVGRVLPATEDDVRIEAVLNDGFRLIGESTIGASGQSIARLALCPPTASPTPGVVEAILDADMVVIGPGSLYTSVIPNLLVQKIASALRQTSAVRVLVANLVSESGETAGLDLADHIEIITKHACGPIVDVALVNDAPIDEEIMARYKAEGASALAWEERGCDGVRVMHGNLLAQGSKLRHDPALTAQGLMAAWIGLGKRRPRYDGMRGSAKWGGSK